MFAHMHSRAPSVCKRSGALSNCSRTPGQLGVVQSEALDRAPANRQHADESLLPTATLTAALPVLHSCESYAPLECGKRLGVGRISIRARGGQT